MDRSGEHLDDVLEDIFVVHVLQRIDNLCLDRYVAIVDLFFRIFQGDGDHVFGLTFPKSRRTRAKVVDTVFKVKEVIFLVAVVQSVINTLRHVEGLYLFNHVFLEAIFRQLLVHNLLEGLNERIIMLLLLLQRFNRVQEQNLKVGIKKTAQDLCQRMRIKSFITDQEPGTKRTHFTRLKIQERHNRPAPAPAPNNIPRTTTRAETVERDFEREMGREEDD